MVSQPFYLFYFSMGHISLHFIWSLANTNLILFDFLFAYLADAANAVVHVRLAKEFVAAKGRDRLLSLGLFNDTPDNVRPRESNSSDSGRNSESMNAYDFMRKRNVATGRDPVLGRWQASIRLGSYAASEGASLCVGVTARGRDASN